MIGFYGNVDAVESVGLTNFFAVSQYIMISLLALLIIWSFVLLFVLRVKKGNKELSQFMIEVWLIIYDDDFKHDRFILITSNFIFLFKFLWHELPFIDSLIIHTAIEILLHSLHLVEFAPATNGRSNWLDNFRNLRICRSQIKIGYSDASNNFFIFEILNIDEDASRVDSIAVFKSDFIVWITDRLLLYFLSAAFLSL